MAGFEIVRTARCVRVPVLRDGLKLLGIEPAERVAPNGHFLAEYGRPGPVLRHGEQVVPELGTALRYVARILGRLPLDPAELARLEEGMDLVLVRLERAIVTDDRDRLRAVMYALERRLTAADWLEGELGVADAGCHFVDIAVVRCELELEHWPAVAAWRQRFAELSEGEAP